MIRLGRTTTFWRWIDEQTVPFQDLKQSVAPDLQTFLDESRLQHRVKLSAAYSGMQPPLLHYQAHDKLLVDLPTLAGFALLIPVLCTHAYPFAQGTDVHILTVGHQLQGQPYSFVSSFFLYSSGSSIPCSSHTI